MSGGRIVNRSELGAIFGVAPTTVDAWVRRNCPVVSRATGRGKGWEFNTASVSSWLREQAVANALGDSDKIDREEAEKRRILALASIAEHDLAEKRRTLINVDAAAEVLRRDYAAVRSRFLALPPKMAPELALLSSPAEVRVALEREVHEILAELSGDLGNVPDDRLDLLEDDPEGSSADSSASTDLDAFRVGRRKPRALAGGKRRDRKVADEPSGIPPRDNERDDGIDD